MAKVHCKSVIIFAVDQPLSFVPVSYRAPTTQAEKIEYALRSTRDGAILIRGSNVQNMGHCIRVPDGEFLASF
jgi:hypothetical protein